MTARPIWLLDVDGVINACESPSLLREQTDHWMDWKSERTNGYRITWSPSLIRRMLALTEHVDIIWLTTWCEHANEFISPLMGLPQFPVLGSTETMDQSARPWWKYPLARTVDDSRPLIWTDDHLGLSAPALAWLQDKEPGTALAIAPHVRRGITPVQLARIEEWVAARV